MNTEDPTLTSSVYFNFFRRIACLTLAMGLMGCSLVLSEPQPYPSDLNVPAEKDMEAEDLPSSANPFRPDVIEEDEASNEGGQSTTSPAVDPSEEEQNQDTMSDESSPNRQDTGGDESSGGSEVDEANSSAGTEVDKADSTAGTEIDGGSSDL